MLVLEYLPLILERSRLALDHDNFVAFLIVRDFVHERIDQQQTAPAGRLLLW